MSLHPSAFQALAGAANGGGAWIPWANLGILAALAAILGALILVLLEVRRLAKEWGGFLEIARDRTGPLVDHAANAVRNLDHVCKAARKGVDRIDGTASRLADDADKAAEHVRGRLGELKALADLAQSEAEDAVLDAAAKLRLLRRGAGLTGLLQRVGAHVAPPDKADGEAPGERPPASRPLDGTPDADGDDPSDQHEKGVPRSVQT